MVQSREDKRLHSWSLKNWTSCNNPACWCIWNDTFKSTRDFVLVTLNCPFKIQVERIIIHSRPHFSFKCIFCFFLMCFCFADAPTSWSRPDIFAPAVPCLESPGATNTTTSSQPVLFFCQWYRVPDVAAPHHVKHCNASLVFNNSHLVAWTVSLHPELWPQNLECGCRRTFYLTFCVTLDLSGIFSVREYTFM